MKSEYLSKISLIGTVIFTVIALINKEITVFYMLYLFWWQAFIEILTQIGFYIKNKIGFFKAFSLQQSAFFMMGIYFVFIVILFGFVLSFSNDDLFILNAQILMFRNIPFNLNLGLIILLAVFNLFKYNIKITDIGFGIFSIKMIVLHVSIILGVVVHFGIRHFYPEAFTDDIYPYLLSAIPFLMLRGYFDWKSSV